VIEDALEQPRPADAVRSALVLSRLGLAFAGNCAVQPVAEVVDQIEREFLQAQARFAGWRASATV
jgi:hypothetical protein